METAQASATGALAKGGRRKRRPYRVNAEFMTVSRIMASAPSGDAIPGPSNDAIPSDVGVRSGDLVIDVTVVGGRRRGDAVVLISQ